MKRLLNFCENVLTFAAVLSVFIIMLLTTADATGRYVFNRPITGAFDITTNYLIVASVFLGMTAAYRNGGFIRVTFLADRLPRLLKLIVNHLVQLVSMLYCAFLVFASFKHAIRALAIGTKLSAIQMIPQGPAYFLVPVGLSLASLMMLIDLAKVRKGKSTLFQEESPTT